MCANFAGLEAKVWVLMVAQADRNVAFMCRDVICLGLLWSRTVQTEVSSVMPGYVQIQLTSHTNCRTGHKTGLSV